MANDKKDLKKAHAKEGYKTKVKTSRQGQDKRMAKRGYVKVGSTNTGTAKNQSGTGAKGNQLGGHVKKTVKRATAYQKPRKGKGETIYHNVRHL